MAHVLVAYASKHGSTAEIAEAIGDELRRANHAVDVTPAQAVMTVAAYDAVIIGSAVYRRRWRREGRRLLSRELGVLRGRALWIFSSGDIGANPDADWVEPSGVLALADRAGARGHAVFGGRVPLAPRNPLERLVVRNTPAATRDRRNFAAIRAWAAAIADELSG
jgi:menaquinone-dependent protoporphyrinogen oxidase